MRVYAIVDPRAFFYSRHHLVASGAEEEFEMLAKAQEELEVDFQQATI